MVIVWPTRMLHFKLHHTYNIPVLLTVNYNNGATRMQGKLLVHIFTVGEDGFGNCPTNVL